MAPIMEAHVHKDTFVTIYDIPTPSITHPSQILTKVIVAGLQPQRLENANRHPRTPLVTAPIEATKLSVSPPPQRLNHNFTLAETSTSKTQVRSPRVR